jgi:hypothetical protein
VLRKHHRVLNMVSSFYHPIRSSGIGNQCTSNYILSLLGSVSKKMTDFRYKIIWHVLAIIYHHYFLQNQLVHHIDINPYMANVLISKVGSLYG